MTLEACVGQFMHIKLRVGVCKDVAPPEVLARIRISPACEQRRAEVILKGEELSIQSEPPTLVGGKWSYSHLR
jgi:hypothetical protein